MGQQGTSMKYRDVEAFEKAVKKTYIKDKENAMKKFWRKHDFKERDEDLLCEMEDRIADAADDSKQKAKRVINKVVRKLEDRLDDDSDEDSDDGWQDRRDEHRGRDFNSEDSYGSTSDGSDYESDDDARDRRSRRDERCGGGLASRLVGRTVRIFGVNFPKHAWRHSNFEGFMNEEDGHEDFEFRVREGLSDPDCVSFELHNFPDHYLRHACYRIRADHPDRIDNLEDATFRVESIGRSKVMFRGVNFPDHAIRHTNFELWLHDADPDHQDFHFMPM